MSLEPIIQEIVDKTLNGQLLANPSAPPPRPPQPPAPGGTGGNMGGMEPRVKALEDSMKKVEVDLAVIKSNYATKADVSDAKTSIILWVVGSVFMAQFLPALLRKFGMG